MAGKGSRQRPLKIDRAQFDKNWDSIFGKNEQEKNKKNLFKTCSKPVHPAETRYPHLKEKQEK